MTASSPSFRPRLALAVAAALLLPLAACKPDAPADTSTAATAPAAATDAASTDAASAPAPAAATGVPAPTSLTEATTSADAASGMCSFDAIDDARIAGTAASAVANPSAVKISGWVGDDASKSRPAEPALRVTGADGRAWEIALGAPVGRGDVSKHFGAEGMANAGFESTYDLSSLPAGDYAVGIAYDRGGARVLCDKGVHIRVGG